MNQSNNDDNLNKEIGNMKINNNDNSNGSKRACLFCLKEVEGSSRCSKCRTALYCNRDCQEKHWPVHRNICKDSNGENSIEKLSIKAENHATQGKQNDNKQLLLI